MVLESLINPFRIEKTPHRMFLVGILYSSVAIILSYWIFRQYSSLLMVFLTVLACIPIMYAIMKLEELKDRLIDKESMLLSEHARAIRNLMYLFLGITVSFAFWYVVLPPDVTSTLFAVQADTITSINKGLTGSVMADHSIFIKILLNNLKVLLFCILFAFAYGAGAIFILVWNASVIAAALGNFIRSKLAEATSYLGWAGTSTYFKVVSLGLLRYSIHGIPEIIAYFIAGLAGGIISIAVINHDFGTTKFYKIIKDTSWLIFISALVLVGAALLEVYVTPLLF